MGAAAVGAVYLYSGRGRTPTADKSRFAAASPAAAAGRSLSPRSKINNIKKLIKDRSFKACDDNRQVCLSVNEKDLEANYRKISQFSVSGLRDLNDLLHNSIKELGIIADQISSNDIMSPGNKYCNLQYGECLDLIAHLSTLRSMAKAKEKELSSGIKH